MGSRHTRAIPDGICSTNIPAGSYRLLHKVGRSLTFGNHHRKESERDDHGTEFDSDAFRAFCYRWGISLRMASVAYPQANEQAEASNKTILHGLKTRLEKAKGGWADELPSILWAYRTTSRVPTEETPFSLAYGTDALIPVEVDLGSP
ncbi:uncharacterized protein LOC127799756 [Diospyros lotus]|uniref:uncharacterized protein LOC127799756 n=1 Tax=Diospyros lotus TaxID=55363 RepID=UPI0022522ED2|nr:uncharacterized protein LOC127799756 [Diospyros lotus]